MTEPLLYTNYYEHCDTQWEDQWACMCNDECPVCRKEIEPYESKETEFMEEAETLLAAARAAQTVFWDALNELEAHLGVDVDANKDLTDTDVAALVDTEAPVAT